MLYTVYRKKIAHKSVIKMFFFFLIPINFSCRCDDSPMALMDLELKLVKNRETVISELTQTQFMFFFSAAVVYCMAINV